MKIGHFILSMVGWWLSSAAVLPAQAQTVDFLPQRVVQLHDSLKQCYAPDKRVELFEVDYTVSRQKMMVRGITTSAPAKQVLMQTLVKEGYEVMDALQVVPDSDELQGKTCGILNVSVANLRVAPDFSSEMTTQGLLGMPVRILQHQDWYRIQMPDRYIAWVHRVGVFPVTPQELEAWEQSEKVVVTAHYGFVYSHPDTHAVPVSDVVSGNRLKLNGTKGRFYRVEYPDGRQGYLEKQLAQPEKQWRGQIRQDAASILHTAHTLMGVPYLWAGTSSKGVDCSGFVRTVFYLHDILLPRDASQQAYVGQRIEIASDFSNLQPGDLLFFGRKATAQCKEGISHVGLYMGHGRFIHSQGDVHVSSLLPADSLFDAFNLNRLLFATRVLSEVTLLTDTVKLLK